MKKTISDSQPLVVTVSTQWAWENRPRKNGWDGFTHVHPSHVPGPECFTRGCKFKEILVNHVHSWYVVGPTKTTNSQTILIGCRTCEQRQWVDNAIPIELTQDRVTACDVPTNTGGDCGDE